MMYRDRLWPREKVGLKLPEHHLIQGHVQAPTEQVLSHIFIYLALYSPYIRGI